MTARLKRRVPRYPDLSPECTYLVIGIEGDYLRIINDRGQPYLYPPGMFAIANRSIPADWVSERGADGERYAYPPQLNAPGFFEDFFDGDRRAQAVFWHTVNRHLARAV